MFFCMVNVFVGLIALMKSRFYCIKKKIFRILTFFSHTIDTGVSNNDDISVRLVISIFSLSLFITVLITVPQNLRCELEAGFCHG